MGPLGLRGLRGPRIWTGLEARGTHRLEADATQEDYS